MSEFFKRQKTWISSAHQGFVREGMHSNTLPAYALAAEKGADMIETDARMTRDGVLIVHHDPDVKGFDDTDRPVTCLISETDFADLEKIRLIRGNSGEGARIPTLEETLRLAYFAGMCVNIDLKEGLAHAEEIARLAVSSGMRGRTVYATNGAGAEAILRILKIDPQARFIDTRKNYTRAGKRSGISRSVLCVHRRFFGGKHRRDSGKRLHAGGHFPERGKRPRRLPAPSGHGGISPHQRF